MLKLTKGQMRTMQMMGLRPEDFPDEALKAFFDFTDKGIKSAGWEGCTIVTMPGRAGDLLGRFMACCNGREIYRDGFKEGWQFPQDFFDAPDSMFEQAALADIDVCGFERSIWQGMRIARSKGQNIDMAYRYSLEGSQAKVTGDSSW